MSEGGIAMKWRKKPNGYGYWFLGEDKKIGFDWRIVDVRFLNGQWLWSYPNGSKWNPVDNYPEYWWSGPILAPPFSTTKHRKSRRQDATGKEKAR